MKPRSNTGRAAGNKPAAKAPARKQAAAPAKKATAPRQKPPSRKPAVTPRQTKRPVAPTAPAPQVAGPTPRPTPPSAPAPSFNPGIGLGTTPNIGIAGNPGYPGRLAM